MVLGEEDEAGGGGKVGCSMASVDDRCTMGAELLEPGPPLELFAPTPRIFEYDTPPMLLWYINGVDPPDCFPGPEPDSFRASSEEGEEEEEADDAAPDDAYRVGVRMDDDDANSDRGTDRLASTYVIEWANQLEQFHVKEQRNIRWHLSGVNNVVFNSKRIVNEMGVLECDESEASRPPRDRVLHDDRVLHGPELGEVLAQLV